MYTEFNPLSYPNNKEINYAILCHLAVWLNLLGLWIDLLSYSGLLVLITVWLLKRKTSIFINHHGKEALNLEITAIVFHLTIFTLGILITSIKEVYPLWMLNTSITSYVIIFLGSITLIYEIFLIFIGLNAACRAYQGIYYRYPLIFRLIK